MSPEQPKLNDLKDAEFRMKLKAEGKVIGYAVLFNTPVGQEYILKGRWEDDDEEPAIYLTWAQAETRRTRAKDPSLYHVETCGVSDFDPADEPN